MPIKIHPDGTEEWLDYQPHRNQIPFHSSNARIKIIRAGRRFGKTVAVVNDILILIEELSRTPWMVDGKDWTHTLDPPILIWVICANYDETSKPITEFDNYTPPWWRIGDREANETNATKERKHVMSLAIRNDDKTFNDDVVRRYAVIEFKSAHNAQLLEGVGPDAVYYFEKHNIPDDAFNTLSPAMISPGRAHKLYYDGVPPLVPTHWSAREWQNAISDQTGTYEAFEYETYHNPLLSVEELYDAYVRQRSLLPEMEWLRYFRVIQPSGTGQYFRKIDLAQRGVELEDPIPGRRYAGGIDWGNIQDTSVLTIKDMQNRHTVFAKEWVNTEIEDMFPQIKEICKHFGVKKLLGDATGDKMGSLKRMQRQYGIHSTDFVFQTHAKHRLYQSYAISLDHEAVSFPEGEKYYKLVEQLMTIEALPSKVNHTYRYQPKKGHDDWVDSELLAHYACDPMELDPELADDVAVETVAESYVFDQWGYTDTTPDDYDDPIAAYKREYVYKDIIEMVDRNRNRDDAEELITVTR